MKKLQNGASSINEEGKGKYKGFCDEIDKY